MFKTNESSIYHLFEVTIYFSASSIETQFSQAWKKSNFLTICFLGAGRGHSMYVHIRNLDLSCQMKLWLGYRPKPNDKVCNDYHNVRFTLDPMRTITFKVNAWKSFNFFAYTSEFFELIFLISLFRVDGLSPAVRAKNIPTDKLHQEIYLRFRGSTTLWWGLIHR